ncbi:MAG TPA: hypothetical protein VFN40_13645 [Gemmatimonadales bacterium]|nr:hypothetical protein [Gemmatimonadales bacterium]
MPAGAKRRVGVLVIAGSVSLLAIGCGGGNKSPSPSNSAAQSGEVVDQTARDQIAKINKYLGTSDDKTNTTLLGNLNSNYEYLRGVIHDLQCDIWKLNHKGETPQNGCPPGTGPSESPTIVPKYPA